MRELRYLFLLTLLVGSIAGCASKPQVRELDPDAFSGHFAAQSDNGVGFIYPFTSTTNAAKRVF